MLLCPEGFICRGIVPGAVAYNFAFGRASPAHERGRYLKVRRGEGRGVCGIPRQPGRSPERRAGNGAHFKTPVYSPSAQGERWVVAGVMDGVHHGSALFMALLLPEIALNILPCCRTGAAWRRA